jgi:hypothetical protein
MRYQTYNNGEIPWILGDLASNQSVYITLYKLTNGSVEPIKASSCTEIARTGIYRWSSSIITQPTEFTQFLYIMSGVSDRFTGKFMVGGFPDEVAFISSQNKVSNAQISTQIYSVGFTTMQTKINFISSQTTSIHIDINQISSQTNNIFPSGDIIRHGNRYWMSGSSGGTTDITPIISELNFISSQVMSISSQISGLSLGGGASPTQIWNYANRSLTGDTDTVKWISSNLEPYGGGGGGGKAQYYAVYGRKSVWTYPQKDKLIKDVEDTLDKLKKFQRDEKDHYTESVGKLEKVLKRVDGLIATLGELKINNKGMEKDIDNVIKSLKKQRELVSTSSQINAAINEINNLSKIVVAMMPDEKLEDVYKELEEYGEGSSSIRIE